MSGLSYITTCNLCGQQFTHHALGDLLESSPKMAIKVFDTLRQHIEQKHKDDDMRAMMAAQTLLGLLRVQHFTSQDESAMRLRDFQRFQIAEIVRKNHCPDDKIVQQVDALGLPDEYVQRVITCVRLMRDIIEERGQFAPQLPSKEEAPSNPASKTGKAQVV